MISNLPTLTYNVWTYATLGGKNVKIHIVQKGDTLWKIAKKYGVNFEELKKMNTHLTNPDMIMPGMKIKVPTTGGSIKKEAPQAKINMGAKKEQPFVKEQPLPKKEVPMKEMPKKEVPVKEVPVKEVPKKPYIPKMPQPIIPEIDINNYYMMNMANMTVQQPPQPPPQPQPIPEPLPEIKEESIESVEHPPVEKPLQGGCIQPMLPCPPYLYPISPVLPGSGLPCPPPYPYYYGAPVPPAPAAMTAPAMQAPAFAPQAFEESSASPIMPHMPMHHQMAAPMTHGMEDVHQPMQQAPIVYPPAWGQMPYGYPQYPYGPQAPISQSLPGSGLPYGQMTAPMAAYPQPGAMQMGDPPNMMPPYQQAPVMETTTPPPGSGTGDCGCGAPASHHEGMAYHHHHGATPYPQAGAPYYEGTAPYAQPAMPYPQGGQVYFPPQRPEGVAHPPYINPFGPGAVQNQYPAQDESSELER
jgi:morphogenetic protein associated with SpoVID